MGKINVGRVVLCGLLAGLVINISEFILNDRILGKDWETAMAALDRPPLGPPAVGVFLTLGFLEGIVMVWIYAAIRPRYGPGPRTAILAGLIVWLLASFFANLMVIPLDIFPSRLPAISMIWALFELPIASMIGAWRYREEV